MPFPADHRGAGSIPVGAGDLFERFNVRLIQAPEDVEVPKDEITLFLAGGISNCPTWQDDAVKMLADTDVVVINPRREGDLASDGEEAKKQIEWEFKMLRESDIILFWFPAGPSPCPIALFELGYWSAMDAEGIVVGCDPLYSRKFDLITQMNLIGVNVYSDLEYVVNYIKQLIR